MEINTNGNIGGYEIEERLEELTEEWPPRKKPPAHIREEIQELREIEDEVYSLSDTYFIHEANWLEHVEDEITSAHGIDLSSWPFNNLDIEGAADDLAYDYSTIDIDGVTFYYLPQ